MKIERLLESLVFKSRWLLAPLYLGLIGALLLLLIKFAEKLFTMIPGILSASGTELLLDILGLVDLVLIANLLLMIIFSGYENFVSKIDVVQGHVDRPDWMGKVDYSALKLKVIGSIVAISSIELLKVFISIYEKDLAVPKDDVLWLVVIHLTFVISGVFLALTERLLHPHHAPDHQVKSE